MSPLYAYQCSKHGNFDLIQEMTASTDALCPTCLRDCHRLMSKPARIVTVTKERLPYGSGSRGRYISGKETGGMDIMIPSWGSMEKEEVDYLSLEAIDKEKARVKQQKKDRTVRRATKQIGDLMSVAYQTKPGQRAKAIKEAMKEL